MNLWTEYKLYCVSCFIECTLYKLMSTVVHLAFSVSDRLKLVLNQKCLHVCTRTNIILILSHVVTSCHLTIFSICDVNVAGTTQKLTHGL